MCMWVVCPWKSCFISIPPCVLAVLLSLHLYKWHCGAYYPTTFWCWVLSPGKQMCCLEKSFFLLRLCSYSGKTPPPAQEIILSILDVLLSDGHWQSGRPRRETTMSSGGKKLWAQAKNVLKSQGCGENSSVCRTLSEGHSQCCLLWAGASLDEISGICFWKTGPMEDCEPPLPAVSS